MTTNYLQALNIGSGLNTTEIVDAIVAARRAPKETRINKKIETREVQVSSLSEIKNSLSSFQTNLSLYNGINGSCPWQQRHFGGRHDHGCRPGGRIQP